ncbi:hypothetical protein D3C83_02800 [compost metagenome]
MLIVSTAKMGRFFRELGSPAGAGALDAVPSAQDLRRFQELAARYGHWNGTPEDNARVGITLPTPSA